MVIGEPLRYGAQCIGAVTVNKLAVVFDDANGESPAALENVGVSVHGILLYSVHGAP
jgi:hypothetical protein